MALPKECTSSVDAERSSAAPFGHVGSPPCEAPVPGVPDDNNPHHSSGHHDEVMCASVEESSSCWTMIPPCLMTCCRNQVALGWRVQG